MRSEVSCAVLSLTLMAGCPEPAAAPTPAKPGEATPGEATPGDKGKPDASPTPDGKRGVKTFDDELVALRRRMRSAIKRSEKVRGYAAWQSAAGTALQIARFTGNYDDFRTAEETLTKTFEAGKGKGPTLLRARFNYHLHRLDKIAADLPSARARALVGGNKARAAVEVFEGNVAMQQGALDQAQAHWAKAETMSSDSAKMALALWAFKTADFATAEASYAFLARNYHGRYKEGAAWLDLMQGIMDLDRGRYDQALAHLDDADADLTGYWLVDEHRAEITALKGDLKTAETMYRDIIERTNSPEFMGALASILKDTGRDQEAQTWIVKATARFDEQIVLYPEAAYGHALGHFLEFGPPERALDLARKNHTVRPNVEAKQLLAQAELAMGDKETARDLIDAALATPWSTADLHYTAYEVYAATGDETKASAQLAKAKAINPHVDS